MRVFSRNLTRSTLVLLALTSSVPLAAQEDAEPRPAAVPDSIVLRGTRVEVSRREVRVIFPREMSRAPEETVGSGVPEYFWMMRSEGVDDAYSLLLSTARTLEPPRREAVREVVVTPARVRVEPATP